MFLLNILFGDKINLALFNNVDLEQCLKQQCRPKIKLGRQNFCRITAGRGWHFVSTCLILDSDGCIIYLSSQMPLCMHLP